jgi:hypothetical protein
MWDKRFVDLQGDARRFTQTPTALRTIYLLARPCDVARRVEPMAPGLSLVECLGNVYQGSISDAGQHRQDLSALADVLTTGTSVKRLVLGHDLADLDQVCRLVIDDIRSP